MTLLIMCALYVSTYVPRHFHLSAHSTDALGPSYKQLAK